MSCEERTGRRLRLEIRIEELFRKGILGDRDGRLLVIVYKGHLSEKLGLRAE